MAFSAKKREQIIFDLLKHIRYSPSSNAVKYITERYSISKQTVYSYISKLKSINAIYTDSNNKLLLRSTTQKFRFSTKNLEEDIVWSTHIKPLLKKEKLNIVDACSYGFTEILNNAIDHSGADEVVVEIEMDHISITLRIQDRGVGIFNKIADALNLETPHQAILELSKGKCTTDPSRHSGEGIFFTSRIFEYFIIFSGDLHFVSANDSSNKNIDILLEDSKKHIEGTWVIMNMLKNSDVSLKAIFDQYIAANDVDYGFTKTVVAVHLIDQKDTLLVSRSQAKRLIRRFEKFREIILDFDGINEIGQAFADEIFRVFKLDHPEITLSTINVADEVGKMINRALKSSVN